MRRRRSANRTQLALSAGTTPLGRTPTHQDYLAELPAVNFDTLHVQRTSGVNAPMASKHKQNAKEHLWDRKDIPKQVSYMEVSEACLVVPLYCEGCPVRVEVKLVELALI